ncbi:MAG: SDR family NAD(P)-dependent oxidoreductase [Clostridia bacterium]|nr:SDR family NAD(P)-dependent oxidoreductase [Clostridia bacterium]
MKKIAVVTGASSGMGRLFAETLSSSGKELDEVWVIARRKDRLEELKTILPARPLSLDLTNPGDLAKYEALLKEEQPQVLLLINASGFGKFRATVELPLEENFGMVDLNCKALMAMCQMTIPYMPADSNIINIASVAAFQPVPYINVYAASKAFVLSYSRGLYCELKPKGITVTAVCPFWTKTEFFNRAVAADQDAVVKKYTAMYMPEQIIKRAWRDMKKGRQVSKFGFVARFQAILAKILPHRFVMWYWMKQQKL